MEGWAGAQEAGSRIGRKWLGPLGSLSVMLVSVVMGVFISAKGLAVNF